MKQSRIHSQGRLITLPRSFLMEDYGVRLQNPRRSHVTEANAPIHEPAPAKRT